MILSLIVPCHNEEKALPLFYKEALTAVAPLACDYEFIFVDDGSSDQTLAVMKDLAATDEHVTYLAFSRNFGKEAAMYAGFCNADGDYVAVLDADLQDPPSLLPEMLRILETGEYDSVATRRVTRQGEPKVRSWFARRFYSLASKCAESEIVDGARDFRLMKRDMVEAIVAMGEANRFSKGIFGWVGFRTYWMDYENVPRAAGETKWSFWKLFRYGIDGIISFSQSPLNIASWMGFGLTFASILALIFLVVRRLAFGDPVAGWASLACIIIFLGGLQLFCMGIMGQYIAKTYMESKNRPHYIVAQTNRENAQKIK